MMPCLPALSPLSCALLVATIALGEPAYAQEVRTAADSAASAQQTGQGYAEYVVGNPRAKRPLKPSGGLMLMGGGEWDYDAFRWFINRAGGGHIVVLRASGEGQNGEEIYHKIGGVQSVRTFVFNDRKASSDKNVLAAIKAADGLFLGGGDQANYVRYWKGTAVADLINRHVAAGKPLGGTSAGLAVQGEFLYGAMDGGSITSEEALADPLGSKVTIETGLFRLPYMDHIITDSHFSARDRLGRLIAFVTKADRMKRASAPPVTGIGVDEETALVIDDKGFGRIFSMNGGSAWLVSPVSAATPREGAPLDLAKVRVTGIGVRSSIDMKRLTVANPSFTRSFRVEGGKLVGDQQWSLAIHGGAGTIDRKDLTPQKDAAYRKGLDEALAAGEAVLRQGGSALDAVEKTVRVLEDNPLFNAGRGAVFTAEGKNELDASIMDGKTLKAGAVAGVTRTRHPISLARTVMDKSRHVMLARDGADRFSVEQGLEQVNPSWFRTEERWQQLQKWKKDNRASLDPTHLFGTVGAVAIDNMGNMAAATSTGGMTGKRWGRIGDSPVIGAGTYARNGVCAASATGSGEYFIRESAGRQLCDRVMWRRQDIDSAAYDTIMAIGTIGGDGGLIAMDAAGRPAFAINDLGMYRGAVSATSPRRTAIYADETIAPAPAPRP